MEIPKSADLNGGETLPQFYGEDRLVILPRDPHNLFAYWEVSPPTMESIERAAGEQWPAISFLLRLCTYAPGSDSIVQEHRDMKTERGSNHRYISVAAADRSYRVELGWKKPGGSFQLILRSNTLRTPRDCISDLVDENWQLPDWKAHRLYRRISLHHLSSAEYCRRRQNRQRQLP